MHHRSDVILMLVRYFCLVLRSEYLKLFEEASAMVSSSREDETMILATSSLISRDTCFL